MALPKKNQIAWGILLLVAIFILIIFITFHLEGATEFSPDKLMFRNAIYLGDRRILELAEWSTPLLDDARDKNPMPDSDASIRWSYVHGSYMVGKRSSKRGEGKNAYRFFRSNLYVDVLTDPKNNEDEVIRDAVKMMRQLQYSEMMDYLFEKRFGK